MSNIRGRLRRNATNIAMVIVMIAAGTILYIQALATSQLQKQVAQQQQIIQQVKDLSIQLNNRADERSAQIDQLNRHLDCVVLFFSQPDRTQQAIDNIETCTLKNLNTGSSTQLTLPKKQTTTPTTVQKQTTTPPPKKQSVSWFRSSILNPIQSLLNTIF